MSGDTRRQLEDAGRRAVPGPDPGFADALEARLRAVGAGLPPATTPPPRTPRFGGKWRLAAGAVVATLALGLVLSTRVDAPRQPLGPPPELAAPVNVEVALADGTVLEDPDGLLLPEGAVVTVGVGGYARIGDTELGPGDVATIRGGRLEIVDASPVAVAPTPTVVPDRTPRPDGTSRSPTPRPRPQPTPAASPRRSPAATRPPVATPAPERTPAPVPASTPEPTPRPPATEPPPVVVHTPTPTPNPPVLRPRLRARLVDGPRIAVRWSETFRARGYVLIATVAREGSAPDPVYPGSRILGEFASPPSRALRYRVPLGVTEVRLQVVALRGDGSVLRRSRIVPIAIPPGDTAGDPDGSPAPTATPTPGPTPTPNPTPTPTP